MKELIEKDVKVKILGKEYQVKELSLAQKIKVFGSISFNFIDEISLAELNFDKIILNTLNILPELLVLSIPDFKDWDNLPESQSREALGKVMEVNDFKGFVVNFISSAAKIIR